ncbi:hypothetical protein D3C84_1016900 [compost metagenome]
MASARQRVTHHADCKPATSTSNAALRFTSKAAHSDNGANNPTKNANTHPAAAKAPKPMANCRNRRP